MKVERVVYSKGDVERAAELCKEELKELMWRHCWKQEIDLPGVEVRVDEIGGIYKITVEI